MLALGGAILIDVSLADARTRRMMLVSCYRCMKMKEEHIVPFSRQAMVLLEHLKHISGDKESLPSITTQPKL